MGLADLPYLTQRKAQAVPKGKTRAETNGEAEQRDTNLLNIWKARVFQRDKGICRCCGRKVKKTLEHVPQRAEAHHLKTRADKAVRYDVRNGLLVCLFPCHDGITTGKIAVTQHARLMFTLDGKSYINGSEPVEFRR